MKDVGSDHSKMPRRNTRNVALVVCSPQTTKGGLTTEAEIAALQNSLRGERRRDHVRTKGNRVSTCGRN
ncbi:hypothetical protein HJC23_005090 [Cyclotella cryptica]|uniref:Uncharacterized protein n=1 Tax=Cyclotella cryptica TaxID=29204 RepID=A0ABD3NV62_9STRA